MHNYVQETEMRNLSDLGIKVYVGVRFNFFINLQRKFFIAKVTASIFGKYLLMNLDLVEVLLF